ncbi:MAG: hypothetical protein ACOYI8_08940 [Christensenellales bacterium]|jgi:hypothetical protein
MKWGGRLFIAFGLLLLAAVIGGMVYTVAAKNAMNRYIEEIGIVLNAATMVNATETYLDEARSVTAEWEGETYVIAPENYKALSNYLRTKCAPVFFSRVDRENALTITFCGEGRLIAKGFEGGDGASLLFESRGEVFKMRISGNGLWEKLLKVSTEGTTQFPNLRPR